MYVLDSFASWARRWKVAINEQKSVYVDFIFCKQGYFPITKEDKDIPHKNSARYLGMFLDKKLNYKEHIKIKCNELNLHLRQLYWIFGSHSRISLVNKCLIYLTILKSVWCYELQLRGPIADNNRLTIQRF